MPTSRFHQHFQGYEILSEIAVSNARVLKARNIKTGALVAIKHFAFNTDTVTIERFQRESEIMTSIQSPFVVKIYDVQLDAELPYIVMEFIDGGDLRSLLKKTGHLDVFTTIQLGLQMADAFRAIHEKGVVHRDIKPENIMYRRLPNGEYHFLLTDFGIAKLREQQITLTGQAMMTYEYASPEQFDDPKNIGAATDYYSLGVAMYECLTGNVPFKLVEGRVHTLMNQVMLSPVPEIYLPQPATLPASLKRLINGLLEKDALIRVKETMALQHLLKKAEMEESDSIKFPFASTKKFTEKTPAQKPSTQKYEQPLPHAEKKSAGKVTRLLRVIIFLIFFVGLVALVDHKSQVAVNVKPESTIVRKNDTVTIKKHIINPVKTVVDTTVEDNAIKLADGTFLDDFTDNQNYWGTNSDSNVERIFRDGKYVINARSDSFSYGSQNKFMVDPEKDFSVVLNVKWVSGITNNGFGIDFCCESDPQEFYSFSISADGSYQVSRYSNQTWNNLVDWTASNYINKNAALNVLSITKTGKIVRFFINDEEVTSLELSGNPGKYFGMRVFGEQTVEFDNFILKGQP